MAMKALRNIASVAVLIAALAIVVRYISTTQATENVWPTVQKAGAEDPAEIQAIKALLELSVKADAEAAQTFDATKYRAVYIDDTAVPLTNDQLAYMTELRTAQRDAAPVEALSPTNGWLTYSIATLRNWQRGAEALEKLSAKARAEGREVTAAELHSIPGIVGVPAPRMTSNSDPLVQVRPLTYKEIIVDGNHALATYDDGVSLVQAFLVKTKDGWRMAGRKNLQVHG